MFVLSVAATSGNNIPPIILEHFNYVPDFHMIPNLPIRIFPNVARALRSAEGDLGEATNGSETRYAVLAAGVTLFIHSIPCMLFQKFVSKYLGYY